MSGTNLELLRELTHQLTLQDVVRKRDSDWVRYDTEAGNCLGICLLHERTVAVQKAFMSRDTVFPTHVHGEVEFIIVYEGCLQMNDKEYRVAEVIHIPNGQEHTVKALEDTWMIAITIPASSAYPDTRNNGQT